MRFIKRLALNRPDPMSNVFAVESDGRIKTTTTRSLELPRGTTNNRPGWLPNDSAGPINGQIRYNTTLNDAELYNESGDGTGWEKIKTNRQANIISQYLGTGNYIQTIFGPLSYDVDQARPQNVLVFTGPAWQIGGTNYTLINSSTVITTATSTVNQAAGTSTLYISSIVGVIVGMHVSGTGIANATTVTSVVSTASSVRISNPTISPVTSSTQFTFNAPAGTYIEFSSAPGAYPINALLGFDGYTPPNS
jgi:hypothetical protein